MAKRELDFQRNESPYFFYEIPCKHKSGRGFRKFRKKDICFTYERGRFNYSSLTIVVKQIPDGKLKLGNT